ncbi:hypothetical protein [Halpernia sp.]|uniref:hypothetical protein n=1 Tax=Halpernia sp. TaxID=2782209 RepID=UPI003A94F8EE
MKKTLVVLALGTLSFATAQTNAFKGSDFENFKDFTESLNHYGLKSYATQDAGKGMGNSAALKIEGTPSGNDYVFTSNATETLPANIKEITFMVKGKADKSLSINLYKTDGSSYKFNIGDLKADSKISQSDNNNYNGMIDTGEKYVKVTLDCSGLTDINKSSSNNFLAIKVGKEVKYNLDIDDIKVN